MGAITHSKNNVSKCKEQRHLTLARIVQNFIERVMNKIQLNHGVFFTFYVLWDLGFCNLRQARALSSFNFRFDFKFLQQSLLSCSLGFDLFVVKFFLQPRIWFRFCKIFDFRALQKEMLETCKHNLFRN